MKKLFLIALFFLGTTSAFAQNAWEALLKNNRQQPAAQQLQVQQTAYNIPLPEIEAFPDPHSFNGPYNVTGTGFFLANETVSKDRNGALINPDGTMTVYIRKEGIDKPVAVVAQIYSPPNSWEQYLNKKGAIPVQVIMEIYQRHYYSNELPGPALAYRYIVQFKNFF